MRLSSAFRVIINPVASELADWHLKFFNTDHGTCKSIFLQHGRGGLGLALNRGWAKIMLDRSLKLVQHPNHPRPTAEAADKDGE